MMLPSVFVFSFSEDIFLGKENKKRLAGQQ